MPWDHGCVGTSGCDPYVELLTGILSQVSGDRLSCRGRPLSEIVGEIGEDRCVMK
jgi:hypothetical protein